MNCPLCKTDRQQTYGNWYWCRECELYFVHPQPSQDELEEFYCSEYWAKMSGGKSIPMMLGARIRAWHRYRLITKSFKTPGRMLDVGCAEGAFMREFNRHGWSADGIDYNINTNADGKYDLIVMSHVLEHMRNPVDELRHYSKFLKHSGGMYIEVPLMAYPPKQNDYLIRTHKTFRHLYGFLPVSLRLTVEQAGLFVGSMSIRFWLPAISHPWYLSAVVRKI